MKSVLYRLWCGDLPLARAFWDFAIIYGSLTHLFATIAAFAALTAGHPWLAVTIFFLPLPYTILVVVGVWRSADRYEGPAKWASLARGAILVWAAIATIA